jgi:hypothetical protein
MGLIAFSSKIRVTLSTAKVSRYYRSLKTIFVPPHFLTLSPLFLACSMTHRAIRRVFMIFAPALRAILAHCLDCWWLLLLLILQIMLFLQGMHSHYQDLLSQFASKHKDLSLATIDSVMANACSMDNFVVVSGTNKPVAPSLTPQSSSPGKRRAKSFAHPWSGLQHTAWLCHRPWHNGGKHSLLNATIF